MPPRKAEPEKYCGYCQNRLHRKDFDGRLEDFGTFNKRKFCDLVCMGLARTKPVVGRQGHLWRARKYRKDACERCGGTDVLHVHHKDHNYNNDDPANYETLCKWCHGSHHGPGRGAILASKQWVKKSEMAAIWVACRSAIDALGEHAAAEELREILHRNGQL